MGKSPERMNYTTAEPTPDGADNMEEKTWVISKKGDKVDCMRLIIVTTLLGISLYWYFKGISFSDAVDLFFYMGIFSIDLLLFVIFKSTGNWDNPKIIKLKNNTIITEEKFPDGYIKKFVIPMGGIYRITMKRRKAILEYKLPDGRDFIWVLIQPGYAREDREKLKEVLEEILKRVDENKVEIVDRR